MMRFILILMTLLVSSTLAFTASSQKQQSTTTISSSTTLFASSSTKKQKKSTNKTRASSTKGFGAAPLTVQGYAATLPNRLNDASANNPCPCGFGETYSNCCQPYHANDEKFPETPMRVLQSRYSAFCYRLPLYIIQTTHPECKDFRLDQMEWIKDLDRSGMFDSYNFVSLTPGLEEKGDDDTAYISFEVKMETKNPLRQRTNVGADANSMEKEPVVIKERSKFVKDERGWRYAGGDISV